MKLPAISIAGEALNFGARRMETIARVAWLPVSLLLIVDMALVFAIISIVQREWTTFADLPANVSFEQAQRFAYNALLQGLSNGVPSVWGIAAAALLLNLTLTASFLAPLIRYAGLGEKPRPGVVRLAFGPDQVRMVFASVASGLFVPLLIIMPIGLAVILISQHVEMALAAVLASFPDPNSLHTIELTNRRILMTENGTLWRLDFGLMALLGLGLTFLCAVVSFLHIRGSRNSVPSGTLVSDNGRDTEKRPASAIGDGFFAMLIAFGFVAFWTAVGTNGFATGLVSAVTALGIVSGALVFLACYFGIRLLPFAGIAVNRRSMDAGPAIRLTRGGNIVRLGASMILMMAVLIAVGWAISTLALPALASGIGALFRASEAVSRLLSEGDTAGWILPVFVSIWIGVQLLFNLFWSFFTYGVFAGFLGRLYRESERSTA